MNLRLRQAFSKTGATITPSEVRKIFRYFAGGFAVSMGYTFTVVLLMEVLHWQSATLASTVSFLIWTPASYLTHRRFTFGFKGAYEESAFKFGVTFLGKLLTSIAVVALLTDWLHLSYIYGVLANWIAIPLVTYVVLRIWVFNELDTKSVKASTPDPFAAREDIRSSAP